MIIIHELAYDVLQGDDLVIMLEFVFEDDGDEIPYNSISEDYDEIRMEVKMFPFQRPTLLLSTADNTLNFFDNIMTAHIPAEFTRRMWTTYLGFLKFVRDGITTTHALVKINRKTEHGGL